MRKNSIGTRFVTAAVAGGLLLSAGTAASAASATGSFPATCDPVNFGYGSDDYYHYHDTSLTTINVKNDGSDRTATTRLFRSTGIALTAYNIAPGASRDWTSAVAAGYYKVQAKASSTANCNAALPGNGNFSFKYKITF